MSAPANGKLAVTSPSLLNIFGATWSDFNGNSALESGHDSFTAEVQVTNSDYDEPLECSSSTKCKFKYARNYTPILHDAVPNQVYAGQRMDFWFDIMGVH